MIAAHPLPPTAPLELVLAKIAKGELLSREEREIVERRLVELTPPADLHRRRMDEALGAFMAGNDDVLADLAKR